MPRPSKPKPVKQPSPSRDAPETARAKVFRTGGSRAVRLPKGFLPDEDEVVVTRVEAGLLISRLPVVSAVATWWGTWESDPSFMAEGRQQPAMQRRAFGG
jgi:virulence-associated protein VagC